MAPHAYMSKTNYSVAAPSCDFYKGTKFLNKLYHNAQASFCEIAPAAVSVPNNNLLNTINHRSNEVFRKHINAIVCFMQAIISILRH